MNIKHLEVEGFKSIYKYTTIDFEDRGLWKISGEIGAGKTTLGECILFGLYGSVKDKNLLNLISWRSKICRVHIVLESRGHNIDILRIVRLKGLCELDIKIDGEKLEYTNKRGGQQILEEEYYDVSRVAVESLCIISFNNFKSILHLNSNSNELRKFVDNVFGFGVINKYIDIIKGKLSGISSKLNEIKYTICTLNEQRTKYEREKNSVDSSSNIEQIADYKNQIKILQEEVNNKKKESQRILDNLQDEQQVLRSKLAKINERGHHYKDIYSKLSSGHCPLCGSEVSSKTIGNIENILNDLRKEYSEVNLKEQEVREKIVVEKNAIKKYVQERDNNIYKLNIEITKLEQKKKLLSKNYSKLIRDIDIRIKELNIELEDTTVDYNKWSELYERINKEGRPTLLSHYIPTLNKNVNYYIQELGQPYNVTFDENFNVTISVYGVDKVPISNLSTGQSKIIDTATILGILKTLMNGVNFNILFLDELFSNTHAELRNTICQMLRRNLPDKLIYIITHADVEDSLFDGVIKTKLVHYDGDKLCTEYRIAKNQPEI